MQSAEKIDKVVGEKSAVNIESFGDILIASVKHVVVWLVVHKPQHLAAIVANHLAVSPGNCC